VPATLTYVDTSEPGITRRKRGRHWHYFAVDGTRITDAGEIARLNRLGVPPAYARVWFCPDPTGHLQAIGFDARGRKQYRYHEGFRQQREADKYNRCGGFGDGLPRLRAMVDRDIAARGLGRTKVLGAVVRLLDSGHVRVGNDVYANENESYGATTLLTEHSEVRGARVKLEYRGKSGKMQRVVIADAALAKIVRRCHDLPGQALFQYVGDDGEPHRIGSADVNAYIRQAMGDGFSAKHFRTWGASVIAFTAIRDGAATLKEMLEPVAAALGNTPAISRKSYVHPALIAVMNEGRQGELTSITLPRPTKYLSAAERGLIAFLSAS
jgi:DNA topoisomerase-1